MTVKGKVTVHVRCVWNQLTMDTLRLQSTESLKSLGGNPVAAEFDDEQPFFVKMVDDGHSLEQRGAIKDRIEFDEAEDLMYGHYKHLLFYDVEEAGISKVINTSYRHTPEITECTVIGLVGDVTRGSRTCHVASIVSTEVSLEFLGFQKDAQQEHVVGFDSEIFVDLISHVFISTS